MIYVVGTYPRRGRRFLANNRRSTLTNRLLTSEGPRPLPAVSGLASPPLEIYRGFVEAAIAGDKCHSALDGEGQGSIPLASLQKWRRRVGSSLAATLLPGVQSVDRMVHVAEARVDLPVNLAKEGIVQ